MSLARALLLAFALIALCVVLLVGLREAGYISLLAERISGVIVGLGIGHFCWRLTCTSS